MRSRVGPLQRTARFTFWIGVLLALFVVGSCAANWITLSAIVAIIVAGLWFIALVTAILSKALEHD